MKKTMNMKRASILGILALGLSVFSGCGNGAGTAEGDGQQADSLQAEGHGAGKAIVMEAGGLKLSSMEHSTAYPDAKLSLVSPPAGADLISGTNSFDFGVEGYELGAQTPDAGSNGLANSDKGQHIHFILNNGPYTAQYTNKFEHDITDGHYVLLAFLSRSYHESVKNPNSYVLKQFVAGQPGDFKQVDLNAPHMFYSRPKGAYKGDAETKKLMLDFFLTNCDLSEKGYKVKASINGTDFTLTKWVPYVIEGLPMGENKIRLELLDAEGKTVESPFNPVERSFTLEAGA